MNYLLDTHTLLWVLFEPEKLSNQVKDEIGNTDNEVSVSLVNLWEISLKYSIGRLELSGIVPDELYDKVLEAGLTIHPLDIQTVLTFYNLPQLQHKDPFDRLLVWQAIQDNLVFISKDKQLAEYTEHGLKLFW